MGSITIRNLDDRVKRKLRVRAALHGRSMEEEARQILGSALSETVPTPAPNMLDVIRRRVESVGGVELTIPARSKRMRAPPRFT